MKCRNISDVTVTRLEAERLGFQLIAGESGLCLLQNVKTYSGDHQASSSVGLGLFPRR
jgi:hypothetical protein